MTIVKVVVEQRGNQLLPDRPAMCFHAKKNRRNRKSVGEKVTSIYMICTCFQEKRQRQGEVAFICANRRYQADLAYMDATFSSLEEKQTSNLKITLVDSTNYLTTFDKVLSVEPQLFYK